MTHHPIRTMPDGTRLYFAGQKYRPVPDGDRIYARRKPDVPGAVLYNSDWVLPLVLLPDAERASLPQTRPDTDAYDHMDKPRKCRCDVCHRPEAQRWKDKWLREHPEQLRSAKRRRRRRAPSRSAALPPAAGTAAG